jgi:TolA-binding protein
MQQSEQDLWDVENAFLFQAFPVLVGVGVATTQFSSAGTAPRQEPVRELSPEAQRGIRSLERRIAEHEGKLAEFKANPTVRPGMEKLPAEVIKKQQQARIQHLETEIRTFQDNIEKLKKGD